MSSNQVQILPVSCQVISKFYTVAEDCPNCPRTQKPVSYTVLTIALLSRRCLSQSTRWCSSFSRSTCRRSWLATSWSISFWPSSTSWRCSPVFCCRL